MIKQMATVSRRPGMTHEEYVNYVRHIHGYQITCSNPLTIRKYVQNYVYDGVYGTREDNAADGYQIYYSRDSLTELYFDDLESMKATFSDPYVRDVVGPDGPNFGDMHTSLSFLVREEEVPVPHPAKGGCKIFYFIKKADVISEAKFIKLWSESHQEVINKNEVLSRKLRKFINNVLIDGGEDDYFGGCAMNYEGIASLWFDTVNDFRVYQAELEEIAKTKDNFINRSKSFAIFTDALTIYQNPDANF